MKARDTTKWQSRGNLRRAHPASGATWNVQVVRGKMTSRCLWHACRALILGMALMLLGGGMATIGYYANDFTVGAEFKGNATVRVKNEHRGLHLNNLSYVGPIIMGVGGFIVVAACVMTFEARDSAAKVVPARFKLSGTRNNTRSSSSNRRNTSAFQSGQGSNSQPTTSQTNRWDQHLGVFRTSHDQPKDRKALTAALVHFSKALGSPGMSPELRDDRRFSRSGSVPNLAGSKRSSVHNHGSPGPRGSKRHHREVRNRSLITRMTRETPSGLLHPGMLQLHRQALSVEENGPYSKNYNESPHGSQGSVSFDPHTSIINPEVPGVHKHRDRTKRSDTARKHVLSRQKPIEKEEPHSPKTMSSINSRRRSSTTISDVSLLSRKARVRRASTSSRTASIDSRGGVGAVSNSSTIEINDLHSPEKHVMSSPRRAHVITQFSTPSFEKEFRSQLSICSEPPLGLRALSCQSSIEPCVPEEDTPEQEEKSSDDFEIVNEKVTAVVIAHDDRAENILRPDNLDLNTATGSLVVTTPTKSATKTPTKNTNEKQKFLYRSNSTKSFKKPKVKTKTKLSNEFDQIYVISSTDNCNKIKDDDLYDSIDVIHERRIKNFSKFNNDLDAFNDAQSTNVTNEIVECHSPPMSALERESMLSLTTSKDSKLGVIPTQDLKMLEGGETSGMETETAIVGDSETTEYLEGNENRTEDIE